MPSPTLPLILIPAARPGRQQRWILLGAWVLLALALGGCAGVLELRQPEEFRHKKLVEEPRPIDA